MYEYEERKDRSSIRGVIVQILLMVMFIFILIAIFPTRSNLDKLKQPQTVSSLEPLYDRIFNDNIIRMKDAAKDYYTTERLPKNVGDSVSMTLGDMLDKKIILPFTDRNGKSCDLEESYVKVTKEDQEYVMKVNLKCSDQENYLLVIMGCYEYCETGICEKTETDVKTPVIRPSRPATIVKENTVRPIYNNNVTINNNVTCENCKPTDPKPEDPDKPNPKPEDPDKPTPQYQCKYMKTTNGAYTPWSSWSDWTESRQTTSILKQERYKTVTQQKYEKQVVGYKTITYKDPNKPIYAPKQVLIGSRTHTECAEYGYVITSTGSVSTNVSYGAWTSAGLVKLYSTPTNTSTVRYTKVSVGTETCNNCSASLYTIYKKEVRTVSKNSNTSTSENSVYKCLRNTTQEIPVYGTQNAIVDYGTSTRREDVYGVVPIERKITLYSYRTRSVTGGSVSYKISNCNDTNLLNQGYQIIDKWQV